MVMATQNPIEQEGTYPLPEAQLDRFLFKLVVRFPTELELIEIARRTLLNSDEVVGPEPTTRAEDILRWNRLLRTLPISSEILQYASRLLLATHPDQKCVDPKIAGWIRYGASPRGLQSMLGAARLKAVLNGRTNVTRSDVNEVALPCLRHRVLLSFEAESDGITPDHVIEEIVKRMNG